MEDYVDQVGGDGFMLSPIYTPGGDRGVRLERCEEALGHGAFLFAARAQHGGARQEIAIMVLNAARGLRT
jgi:hypothetical protein